MPDGSRPATGGRRSTTEPWTSEWHEHIGNRPFLVSITKWVECEDRIRILSLLSASRGCMTGASFWIFCQNRLFDGTRYKARQRSRESVHPLSRGRPTPRKIEPVQCDGRQDCDQVLVSFSNSEYTHTHHAVAPAFERAASPFRRIRYHHPSSLDG